MITTTDQLEEILSRPSQKDCEALRNLEGDLLILGVGGKMGPSLAVRARRAMDEVGLRSQAPTRARTRVIAVSRFSDARLRASLEQAGVETIAALRGPSTGPGP
jgi:hypothetical protein